MGENIGKLQSPREGYLLILAAAVLWGTTGTAQALAPPGASSLAIGALRLVVGGLALLGISLSRWRSAGKRFSSLFAKKEVLVAAGCMAAYQVLFFAGVARTGVAVGTMVGIGSSPILAGLLALLFRGERPGRRWTLATALAVAGCALLALQGKSIDIDLLGMLLAVGAGGAYAAFSLASKGLLEQQPVEQVMAPVFCLGAVLLSPVLLFQDLRWLRAPGGVWVILHLGLLATALAYMLFGKGLRQIPVASAVTLSLAEPMTAGILGIVLLGERFTLPAGLGMALIFSGLFILSLRRLNSP